MVNKLTTKQMLYFVFKCLAGVGIKRKDCAALSAPEQTDRKHTGQRKVLGLRRDREREASNKTEEKHPEMHWILYF